MIVGQKARSIDEIAKSTETKGHFDTQAVDERACEEAYDREGGVESSIGIVGDGAGDLSASTQAIERVEHSWTKEADEGDEDELRLWRGVPGQADGPELERFVDPTIRSRSHACVLDVVDSFMLYVSFHTFDRDTRLQVSRSLIPIFGLKVGHNMLCVMSNRCNVRVPVEVRFLRGRGIDG